MYTLINIKYTFEWGFGVARVLFEIIIPRFNSRTLFGYHLRIHARALSFKIQPFAR